MLIIFFLILGIIALLIAGSIVIRKFPQLANLDTHSLPQEREAQKKREILLKRVENEGVKLKARWGKRFIPFKKIWGKLQLQFRVYVGRIERLWHHEERARQLEQEPAVPVHEQEQKLQDLIRDGDMALQSTLYDRAEELFIAAIKLDARSAPAYRGLADTYASKGSYPEAKETYEFLLQLTPNDDAVLVKLADIAEQEGNLAKAVECYERAVTINDGLSPRFYHLAELLLRLGQPEVARDAIVQAVELEPKNPKYLDLLLETVILCGDKELALQAYNELRLVNPDNQKLPVFQERIARLSESTPQK